MVHFKSQIPCRHLVRRRSVRTVIVRGTLQVIPQKDLDNIQIGDKSDFFPAITRASRMLMGNDDEQPGHLVYVSDGRLILRNLFSKSITYRSKHIFNRKSSD